jgi:hypothetical protein
MLVMKSFKNVYLIFVMLATAAIFLSGCSSSGTTANVVAVTVTPPAATVIAGQPQTFTATVTGTTNTTVTNWPCTYSYVPPATTANPNPKAVTGTCTSGGTITGVTGKIGTWTISTANSSNVLTYTAPVLADFPNPVPLLTFKATADADKNKTGTATVGLDSGIRVSITPNSATVPVGLTPAQTVVFVPSFLNANASGQQFKLVQPNTASTTTADQTPAPQTPDTCDPNCGTIDNATGVYSAPATLPTDTKPAGSKSTAPTTVYVVAWNSADPNHYAIALVTLVSSTTNPVTFSGLYPPTVPAGGLLQDVFLNAKNVLNSTFINFVPPTAQAELTASSGNPIGTTQIFTIPVSGVYCTASATGVTPVVTCDASLMTRVRLNAAQLTNPEPDPNHPAWIMIPNLPGSQTATAPCVQVPNAGSSSTAIACPLHLVNASPGLVAAAPDNFPQVSGNGTINISVDGGYYGATGGSVNLTFDGQATLVQSGSSNSRKLLGIKDNFQLPDPGLYEVSVTSSTTTGAPPLFKVATTNAAVQPNFAVAPTPTSVPLNTTTASGTNLAPSAVALNSVKGYAVITEQAGNSLQLISLTGAQPAQVGNPFQLPVPNTPTATASSPTDIAIDDQLSVNNGDLGIVVSSGDSTLYLYSINPQSSPAFTFVKSVSVDLRTLLGQPTATGLPAPAAFGVDPTTHLGVVAYSGTNIGTNIAFIVDVNPNLDGSDTTHHCFLAGQVPPCVISPVTVVTGPSPRVVPQPGVPLAYVTPGGANGSTAVVDLLQTATSAQILPAATSTTAAGAFRSAGVTTIKTETPHGINASLGGTVIISGLIGKGGTNFNGTFSVSVVDPYTFQYAQTGLADDQETNTGASGSALGTVQYGSPYYSFSTSANVSGAAINPVTRTFAYADFASYVAQIGFISTLDQSLTSLSLSAGSCNGCTPTPAGGPENGFRSVAWDPFTDVLVAYDPGTNTGPNFPENSISLINPGGPAPIGSSNPAYRIIAAIPTGQVGQGSYTPAGASAAVPVYGPMTYDPKSKFVLVANAGSNTLTYMNLDPTNSFKKIHIQNLRLPDNSCTTAASCFAVPIAQPALGSLTSATTCSPTNPLSPCMPQAVRVGKDAVVRVLGQGFTSAGSNPVVRLDGQTAITPPGSTTPVPITTTLVSDTEVDATIPAAALFAPHDYALDVQASANGVTSNAVELYAVGILDMSGACAPTSVLPQGPEGVAIDQTRRIAVVTNYACNTASVINLDMTGTLYPGAPYGAILGSVGVGKQPVGVGIISRLGYAVVGNNGDAPTGTASIIDISNPSSPKLVTWTPSGSTTTSNAVSVGLSPLGVAIDQDRALALLANAGSNTLSAIDLTVLFPSETGGHTQSAPVATTIGLSGPPAAVAVDPNRAEAVVTNLLNAGTTSVTGGLDVISLASVPPARLTSSSVSGLTVNPTGIVCDPGDPNQTPVVTGRFYVTSTQQNAVYFFNPDTASSQTIRVGVNPYSVGFNYQTGTLLTINSTSNTSSVIDSQNFKTRETLAISSMSQFAMDVDQFQNMAVIVDQNNNRVVFLALPR